jgi:hypothetical protein
MYAIDVTDPQQVARALRYFLMILDIETRHGGLRSIRVGIDPLDNGLKFSVDYGTWSPPMAGKIET